MKRIKIYSLISAIIFLTGVTNILSSLFSINIARLEILDIYIPVEISNFSRSLVLLIGIFLLFLAKGLWEKKYRAWFLSLILIGTSLILHILKGLDYEESFLLIIPFYFLLRYRNLFYVKSVTHGQIISSIKNALLILFLLFIYSFFGFYIFSNDFSNPVTLKKIILDYEFSISGVGKNTLIPITRQARWFEDSITIVGMFSLASILAVIFKPLLSFEKAIEENRSRYRELALKYGKNTLSYMGLIEDKIYYFNSDKTGVLSYKIKSGVAIALGDPVAPDELKQGLIKEFTDHNNKNGLKTAFVGIPNETLSMYKNEGLNDIKVGEEAIMDVQSFSLEGSSRKDIRNSISRIEREEIKYLIFKMDEIPLKNLYDFEGLYNEWIVSRKFSSLSFSFNYYPLPAEKFAYLILAYSKNDSLFSALTYYPYDNLKNMSLDLMLKSKDSINGIMEATIAKSVEFFKDKNISKISLGTAPLLDITPEQANESKLVKNIKKIIFENFNQLYNYKSLADFKKKFDPEWKSTYITYSKNGNLTNIMAAVIQVSSNEPIVTSVIKKLFSNAFTYKKPVTASR